MSWPFTHIAEDGRVYLHLDNWIKFKKEKEQEYTHDWNHRRLFMRLFDPLDSFTHADIITTVFDGWSVIYEPFPAYARTTLDPEGWKPSWHIWVEDNHAKPTYGEEVILYSTGVGLNTRFNVLYAAFRGQFWRVDCFWDYGIGLARPPAPKKKKKIFRTLDDPFNATW